MEVCADTIHKQLPTIDLNSAKELILKARKNKTTSFLKEFTRKEIEQLFISMCIALDIKNFDDEEDAYEDAEDGQFKAPDLTPVSTTVTKPLSDKDKGEENNVNVESVTMNEKNKEASRKICRAYRQKVCSFGKRVQNVLSRTLQSAKYFVSLDYRNSMKKDVTRLNVNCFIHDSACML